MLGGMLILRVIAASDVATDHTHAQMYPRIPGRQAFFATFCTGHDLLNQTVMTAFLSRGPAAGNVFADRID
jgi:hypothetical protein